MIKHGNTNDFIKVEYSKPMNLYGIEIKSIEYSMTNHKSISNTKTKTRIEFVGVPQTFWIMGTLKFFKIGEKVDISYKILISDNYYLNWINSMQFSRNINTKLKKF
jgi:hypothetical protein